jgi:hypothetical protein
MKTINMALACLLFSSIAVAQEYQLFSELGYQRLDTDYADTDIFSASGKYYFKKKQALGPWAEFDYLNTKSNVSAYYTDFDHGVNELKLGGEVFYNKVLLGASYKRSDTGYSSYNTSSATLGYLIKPYLLVKAEYVDAKHGGNAFFSTRYIHSLGASDYIGVNFSVNDDFDHFSGSGKYFAALGQDRYLAAEINVSDDDGDTSWGIGGDYYLSQATSVGAGYQDFDYDDGFEIRARHYFTQNWALSASYTDISDNDLRVYQLGLIGQF